MPGARSVMRHTGKLDASNGKTTGGNVPGGKRRKSATARFEIVVTAALWSSPG